MSPVDRRLWAEVEEALAKQSADQSVPRKILRRPCESPLCAGKGHYEMPGRCGNCRALYTLHITKGHEAPRSWRSWECPNCGCREVVAE